jgi:hypothetical protein
MIPDDGVAPLGINGVDGRHPLALHRPHLWCADAPHEPSAKIYKAVSNAGFLGNIGKTCLHAAL